MKDGRAKASKQDKGRAKVTRAKDLEVSRVYLGLRTPLTAGNVEKLAKTGLGTRNNGTNSNLNLKLEARLEVCVCVLTVDRLSHRTVT